MRIYKTKSGIQVIELTWTEYQAKKKAREITPEPQTLNLSYKKPRAGINSGLTQQI